MTNAVSNIFHYFKPNSILAFVRVHQHRRITIRHVLLVLSLSTLLSVLYYLHLRRTSTPALSEEILLWPPDTPQLWSKRAAQVKRAFQHAYHGYEQHAFPHDELLPLSNGSTDNFNGWGVTAVDSLDTMLLMGLQDEYSRALPMIKSTNFSLPSNEYVPFFETVIRYLGGFLSAHALSGDDLLREKADELATKLAPAFNTLSKLPAFSVNTFTGNNFSYNPSLPDKRSGVLAEIASFQMEYAYLAKITGRKEHMDHVTLITDILYNANLSDFGGMYPTLWNLEAGTPTRPTSLTVGAFGDSGHEYTLKQFLMTARTDKRNLEMYIRFTSHVINNLLYVTPDRQLLYVTDATVYKRFLNPTHRFEHLSCFLAGLFALGAHLLPLNDLSATDIATLSDDLLPRDKWAFNAMAEFNLADLHLWVAEGIAQTCYLTYVDQPTGLGPESMRMHFDREMGAIPWIVALRAWNKNEGSWWRRVTGSAYMRPPPGVGDIKPWTNPLRQNATLESFVGSGSARGKGTPVSSHGRDYFIKNAGYYLRPETVESLYILWRTTGDVKWRHRGWRIFRAIERHTKTATGYASVEGVNSKHPTKQDSMPSYFLAETLKYLYLLFSNEDPLPLEEWVFTTEAHALPVFEWSKEERQAYGII